MPFRNGIIPQIAGACKNTRVLKCDTPSGRGRTNARREGPAVRRADRERADVCAPAVASLGTIAKSASPPQRLDETSGRPAILAHSFVPSKSSLSQDEIRGRAAVRRYALQSAAKSLMPSERVGHCLRHLRYGASEVEIWKNERRGRACYAGLQTCGSVWMCAVCAARITEHRRGELQQAIAAWPGEVVMVTYTTRHNGADKLVDQVEGLTNAKRHMTLGAPGQRLYAKHGIAGTVRALEVTHGVNGWHPHIHELLFCRPGVNLDDLQTDLRARWDRSLARASMRSVNEHGLQVSFADGKVAEYVAKYGRESTWSVAHELTKQPMKVGIATSRTPVQLLSEYLQGDDDAGKLWQEYAGAFKGRRQLVWSRGLRAQLLPDPEKSDEQVAEETEREATLFATLSLDDWRVIVGNDARAEVLNVASIGDIDALAAYIDKLKGGVIDPQDQEGQHPKQLEGCKCIADLELSSGSQLAFRSGASIPGRIDAPYPGGLKGAAEHEHIMYQERQGLDDEGLGGRRIARRTCRNGYRVGTAGPYVWARVPRNRVAIGRLDGFSVCSQGKVQVGSSARITPDRSVPSSIGNKIVSLRQRR